MQSFDLDELFVKYRYPLLILLVGFILLTTGILFFKSWGLPGTKVEVLSTSTQNGEGQELTVEISGSVITPGVYKFPGGARIDDLIIKAGGFSLNADRSWTEKYLNRAAKLTDGQKVFVPSVGEQSEGATAKTKGVNQTASSTISSDSSGLININTASLSQLDSLPGIGQTYGQNIIEHRPYSNTLELVSKGVIKQSLYEKIKDRVTIY